MNFVFWDFVMEALCLLVLLSPVGVIVVGKRVLPMKLRLLTFPVAVILFAALYLGALQADGWLKERKLYSFDLNHDGVINPGENTPAAQAAMEDLTNDAGTTIGRLYSPVIAFFYCGFVFVMWGLFEAIWFQIRRARAGRDASRG